MSSREFQPDWLLLDRFLARECSPDETAQVQQWLDEHPEFVGVGALREAIDRLAPPGARPVAWDVDQAWTQLAASTRAGAESDRQLPPLLHKVDGDVPRSALAGASFEVGRIVRPVRWAWLRLAAAIVILVGMTGVLVRQRATSGTWRAPAAATGRVIATQRAERTDLRLADGTRVVLAPESRLVVPADFGGTRRAVMLVGEGYFDVVHDAAKPFLVYAAHGVVHDLGTRFSVRAYPGDATMQVVVAQGRVVAALAQSALPPRGPVLEAGDLARLDTAGAMTVTRGVDVDLYQSWIEGRLRFDAVPLAEVAPQLARWYGLDVELADSALARRRVTLTLRNESLAQLLDEISHISDARYERTDRRVRFFARPTRLSPRAP